MAASLSPVIRSGAAGTYAGDLQFTTTHWTIVLQAGGSESLEKHDALAEVCNRYWLPIYSFIRRSGHTPEDAQDLTQGFFAHILDKDSLKGLKREKGKFRTFLLMVVKRFLSHEWRRANRLKRGGGYFLVPFKLEETETRYSAQPVDDLSPEKLFDRNWALALLDRVMARLEAEFSVEHNPGVFEELKPFLSGEANHGAYAEISSRLGLSNENARVMVHRLRRRYRELLRLEIAPTVDGPEAVDEEIRHLFAALAS